MVSKTDFYSFFRKDRWPHVKVKPGARRDDRIVALRAQGKSNSEIAAELGLKLSSLTTYMTKLIREGRVKALRANAHTHRAKNDVPTPCDEAGSQVRTEDVRTVPAGG
jgi:DNA invertase Pin-like site-specific DNA recombinase